MRLSQEDHMGWVQAAAPMAATAAVKSTCSWVIENDWATAQAGTGQRLMLGTGPGSKAQKGAGIARVDIPAGGKIHPGIN